jgi:hypothetical protein
MMFESLVKGLADTELAHLLRFIDEELDGVEARLHEKTSSSDSVAMMLAYQQLDLLEVWRPMVKGLITKMEATNAKADPS